MKVMQKCLQIKLLAVLLICALMPGILPLQDASAQQNISSPAGYGLSNPIVDSNGVTTWDCIYFGNYWQNGSTGAVGAEDSDGKQKIKWRVLSVEGDNVFLLSDRNLSWQVYNSLSDKKGVKWETSTVRSWLNGYGAEDNICGQDYTDDNFLDDAFDAFEQAAISDTLVINTDNSPAFPDNGNDTVDKVYLLSVPEIMKDSYGFESTWNKSKKRVAKNTDHINSSESNGEWWLRTVGMASSLGDRACYVDGEGRLWRVNEEASVSDLSHVVRPALHLNLSARDGASNLVWSYAGKITSNGEEIEAELPTPVVPTESPEPVETTAAPTPVVTPQSPTQKPAATEEPTQKPAETEEPAQEPAATEKPAQEPAETEEPTQKPTATEKPTQKPAATEEPSVRVTRVIVIENGKMDLTQQTVKKETVEAQRVLVSEKSVTMGVGEKVQLEAVVYPKNASGKKLTYQASNNNVEVNGKGKITARKPGKCKITISLQNGKSAVVTVTVKKKPTKLILNASKKTLKVGKKFQIKPQFPKDTAGYKVTFVSGKETVAAVSKNGKVTAKKKGNAVIVVKTYNGVKAVLKIRVV